MTLGEVGFLPDLRHQVPFVAIRTDQRGRDELGADIALTERPFVNAAHWLSDLTGNVSDGNSPMAIIFASL
jgi:hypothetical protein